MANSFASASQKTAGGPISRQRAIVAHTIRYRSTGTRPPVYLAGSFTEPQWVPHEMDYSQDAEGEYTFVKHIRAVPGHEYQFKFKVGDGNNWALDENSPVGTDSIGNENNILNVPLSGAPNVTRPVPGKVLNELGIVDAESGTSTPIAQVAETAAEVADTAQTLDREDNDDSGSEEPSYSWKDPDSVRSPLFAHESLGAYEFVDDGIDHTEFDLTASLSRSRSKSNDYAIEEVDVNDPSIERFPSDRGSVFDTLRKIQSSSESDQVHLEPNASSPRNVAWRRTSLDSTDENLLSPISLSPASPTSSRKRENRLSHSKFETSKSAASLGSIAEEPKTGSTAAPPSQTIKKSGRTVFEGPETSASEEDDVSQLAGPKVNPNGGCHGESFTQDMKDEQPAEHANDRDSASIKAAGYDRVRLSKSLRSTTETGVSPAVNSQHGPASKDEKSQRHQRSVVASDSNAPKQRPRLGNHHIAERITFGTISFLAMALGFAWLRGSR